MRRMTLAALMAVVLAGTGVLGYGVTQAFAKLGPSPTGGTLAGGGAPEASPAHAVQGAVRAQPMTPRPAALRLRPELVPGKALLREGSRGPAVRDLQARLKQVGWYGGLVGEVYDGATVASVRGFQAKRRVAVTGFVDRRTLRRLHQMTRVPTADELHNRVSSSASTRARLDVRCTTGRALCIDKTSRTVRFVVDGLVLKTMAVRFGSTISNTPTREGSFRIGWKSRNHHSKLFDSPMPFAMFFSGGQAVHYSSDFAARGYNGASHGCVNVRDYNGVKWLFDQTRIGDKVIVYWS